nr:uncharacterized protein YKR070W-like [Ipomoea trifida]
MDRTTAAAALSMGWVYGLACTVAEASVKMGAAAALLIPPMGQVLFTILPAKSIFENEFIVAGGKGEPAEVMSEYGFK